MAYPCVHFDIGCKDLDRSAKFFTDVFGWSAKDYGPLSKEFDTGTRQGIQGFTTALGHEPHNYVMVYIEVPMIEEVLASIVESGGEIVIPATEVPGQGRFAWFKDPHKNMLGLWTPSWTS